MIVIRISRGFLPSGHLRMDQRFLADLVKLVPINTVRIVPKKARR